MAEPVKVIEAISEIEKFISEKKMDVGDASIAMTIILGRNIGKYAASIDNLTEGSILHAKKTFVEALQVYAKRQAETPG
jgi:hypothetical protein